MGNTAHQQGVKAVRIHLHSPFQARYSQPVLIVLSMALPQHKPRLHEKKRGERDGTRANPEGETSEFHAQDRQGKQNQRLGKRHKTQMNLETSTHLVTRSKQQRTEQNKLPKLLTILIHGLLLVHTQLPIPESSPDSERSPPRSRVPHPLSGPPRTAGPLPRTGSQVP